MINKKYMIPTNTASGLKHVLTPEMIDSLIEKTEISIREEKIQQSTLDNDLKTAKELYDQVKGKYDTYQAKIDKENDILEVLVRYKTNANANKKEIKVFSHISNTKQKPQKKKLIKWLPHVLYVLRKYSKFMSSYELIKECVHNDETLSNMNLDDRFIKNTSYYFDHQARAKRSGLIMYEDKIGLIEWFDVIKDNSDNSDNSMVLKPQYLKQFMG